MAIARWSPMRDLRQEIDRLFDDASAGEAWAPAIDVVRDDGKITVRADVPGVKPEEIEIEVDDDVLTISGRHEEEKEEKKENYLRRERRVGSFSRSIRLPAGVASDDIEATCEDGKLEVTIPAPKRERDVVKIKPKG
jgi:HSP20 family protein